LPAASSLVRYEEKSNPAATAIPVSNPFQMRPARTGVRPELMTFVVVVVVGGGGADALQGAPDCCRRAEGGRSSGPETSAERVVPTVSARERTG